MFDRKSYMKEYHKKDYKNNKEKIDTKNREYYEQHKEEISNYKKNWHIKNRDTILKKQKEAYDPIAIRKYHLKSNYGITEEEYALMLENQDRRCAICHKKTSKRLHVDHDHKTGKIRGLLCQKCNHGLGQFNDDTDLLHRASEYLIKSTSVV